MLSRPQAILAPTLTTNLIQSHLGAGKHVQTVIRNHPGRIILFLKVLAPFSEAIL